MFCCRYGELSMLGSNAASPLSRRFSDLLRAPTAALLLGETRSALDLGTRPKLMLLNRKGQRSAHREKRLALGGRPAWDASFGN